MSGFLSPEAAALAPYTPGEQPQNRRYVKLNTNESPFPPSPRVTAALTAAEIGRLNLYSDPTCADLNAAVAARCGLRPEQVICGNGSDELLAFALRAFCGTDRALVCPDVTYGFYPVWAGLFGLSLRTVPLRPDFTLDTADYLDLPGTVVIANPNAPTGLALPAAALGRLAAADPGRVVIVDEAYVDFGAESCVPLLAAHPNLLVVQTFSKSRSLAGGRVGFALGSPELIADLNRVKYSFNPYNLNRLSLLAGIAAMEDEDYFAACTARIREVRAWTAAALAARGFEVLPGLANFLFARTDRMPGGEVSRRLKENGVLVRRFDAPRTADWCRITIGAMEQMETLMRALDQILEAKA